MSGSSSLGIPLLAGNSAPGNYLFEENQTTFAQPPATTIGGMVVATQKGDIQPTLCTGGPAQIIAKYGTPNPNWSLSLYSALQFSYVSSPIVLRRVVNVDCLAAASFLFPTAGVGVQAIEGLSLQYTPFTDLNYNGAVPEFSIITTLPNFSSLASSTPIQVSYQLNGGSTTTVSTTIGSNLSQLAANLNAALNSLGASALVGTTTVSGAKVPCIYFAGPSNATFLIVSVTFSSTTANPLAVGTAQDCLAIIAQNPGAWPNQNIGWSITNVNFGTPQQVTLIFSRQFATGDQLTFQGNVYTPGVAVNTEGFNYIAGPITYATSNDATMTALATALTQSALGVTAAAVIPDATGNNSREIILTFQTANLNGNFYATPNTLSKVNNGPLDYSTAVVNTVVTGGALSALVQQSVVGVASNNTFNLNIYQASNPNTPLEVWTGSLTAAVDGFSATLNLPAQINNDDSGSQVVRLVNLLPSTVTPFPNMYDNIPTIQWLGGGADGTLPTNTQIATAWGDFANTSNVDVDLLMCGGYNSPVVQQAMDAVCQTRSDVCFAYMDVPSSSQATAAGCVNYRTNSLGLNSNRSALFTPDYLINDPYTGQQLYLPLSGYEAALQAAADNAVGPQQAAAGPVYGALNNILGLRVLYNKTDRGLLNSNGINAAKKLRKGGYAVYGAVTLATIPSLLTYIPVRRIFSTIEETVLDLLEGVDFNNITPTLELNVQQSVNKILGLYIQNGAIQNGSCITDATVNTQVYADNGQFNVRVFVYPFSPAQFVVLDAVLTNNSAVFTESVVNS